MSIVLDLTQNEIKLFTDSGRPMRPLLIVKNNQLVFKPSDLVQGVTFENLMRKGVAEYVDIEEE